MSSPYDGSVTRREGGSKPAANPTVSVIVVSFNVANLLRRCLRSLEDADEIIVVDNNSADDSRELVLHEFPQVRLISNPINVGFSAAVNAGMRAASGGLVLLLNPDAELPPGSLHRMAEAMLQQSDAGALGFRQVNERGAFQLSVGPRPSFPLELGRMVIQRQLDRGNSSVATMVDRALGRARRRVSWVSASALMVRPSAFDAVGGFDESFFLYFEDADFCLRLGRSGYPVYYVPEVTVIHRRGQSAAGSRALARSAYRASQRLYWRKHRGRWAELLITSYQRLLGADAGGA
jgi:GT2 family glycosyltransferase